MRGKTEVLDIYENTQNNDNFFSKIDTEQKAFFLGVMVTDGSVSTKYNRIYLKWSARKKYRKEHVELLSKFASIFGAKTRIAKENYVYKKGEDKGEQATSVYVSFSNKKVRNDLIRLGVVPNKTYKDTSRVIYNVPDEIMHHHVRGVFAGDGFTSHSLITSGKKARRLSMGFTCHSKLYLETLRDVITSHVNVSSRKIMPDKNSFELAWYNGQEIIEIRDWMYKDATIYLPRKKERLYNIAHLHLRDRKHSSPYRGVYETANGTWGVDFSLYRVGGKRGVRKFKTFDDETQAACQYDKWVMEYDPNKDRRKSKLNFPEMWIIPEGEQK